MTDSPSYWSDWVNNITTAPKGQQAPAFDQRFGFPGATTEPDVDISRTGGDPREILKTLSAMQMGDADALAPVAGPQPPRQMVASQQPNIPIQGPQGAPQTPTQSMQTAPNSGVVGQSPYSNQALTGGGGFPMGGLPTQQPTANLGSPQQVNPQQMQQPPLSGPANPQFRMQNHQQNMQNFVKLLASLRGYNFLGQS